MPRRTTLALLTAACLAGITPPIASGQDKPNPPPPPKARQGMTGLLEQPPRDRPTDVLALDERITIDFKGGTVEDYIQAVREAAAPKAVNILVPSEVNEILLPTIRLQSVTLWTAWSALEPAIRAQPAGLEIAITMMGERDRSLVSSEAVQMLVDRHRNRGVPLPGDPVRTFDTVEVISIADLVEPRAGTGEPLMKVEDLLAAVDAAGKVANEAGNPSPNLKYHPASGVLISRGGPGANALVNEVVSTVRKNAAARTQQLDRVKLANDVFEQRLVQAKAEYEAASVNMESTQRRLDDLQKLADQGSVSKMDVDVIRQSYNYAASQAEQFKQQLSILERTGPGGVLTELTMKGQQPELSDRVAQLEREVETLKAMVGMGSTPPQRPAGQPRLVR